MAANDQIRDNGVFQYKVKFQMNSAERGEVERVRENES